MEINGPQPKPTTEPTNPKSQRRDKAYRIKRRGKRRRGYTTVSHQHGIKCN